MTQWKEDEDEGCGDEEVHSYHDDEDDDAYTAQSLSPPDEEMEDDNNKPQSTTTNRLLSRRSSMRLYVINPYFRLAVVFQPVLEFAMDAYLFIDHLVVSKFDEIMFVVSLCLVFFGLLVTFYGSHVSRTVSFVSAFRNDRLRTNCVKVRHQIFTSKQRLREISNSTVPSVLDNLLASQQRRRTKKLVAILGEVDPNVASDIIADCWRSVLFACATAKLHHAKTISLGLMLGEHVDRPIQRYVVPALMGETREELSRWYSVLFLHVCSVLGVVLAFHIEVFQILGVISTSVKGAHMIVSNAGYLVRTKYKLSPGLEDILVMLVALLGITIQVVFLRGSGGAVPVSLQLVWFPIFIVENWLIELVRWM